MTSPLERSPGRRGGNRASKRYRRQYAYTLQETIRPVQARRLAREQRARRRMAPYAILRQLRVPANFEGFAPLFIGAGEISRYRSRNMNSVRARYSWPTSRLNLTRVETARLALRPSVVFFHISRMRRQDLAKFDATWIDLTRYAKVAEMRKYLTTTGNDWPA